MLKIILTGVFVLSMICASAQTQEKEVKASSATDSEVTIHEGKRVKATSPQKTFKPKHMFLVDLWILMLYLHQVLVGLRHT